MQAIDVKLGVDRESLRIIFHSCFIFGTFSPWPSLALIVRTNNTSSGHQANTIRQDIKPLPLYDVCPGDIHFHKDSTSSSVDTHFEPAADLNSRPLTLNPKLNKRISV